MLQRDFLMRQIQEFARIIALALRFRYAGDLVPSLETIEGAYDELPNIEQTQVKAMTGEELLSHLIKEDLHIEFIDVLSNLLFEEGETLLALERTDEANAAFRKAAALFAHVAQEKKEFSFERMNQQQRIRVVLAE